jgi:hypothetical protein
MKQTFITIGLIAFSIYIFWIGYIVYLLGKAFIKRIKK